MDKSILNEIDRLEGIAQAYARRRPLVSVIGVVADCLIARGLVEDIDVLENEADDHYTDIASLQDQVRDIRLEIQPLMKQYSSARGAAADAQADLDNLMASLSARLER